MNVLPQEPHNVDSADRVASERTMRDLNEFRSGVSYGVTIMGVGVAAFSYAEWDGWWVHLCVLPILWLVHFAIRRGQKEASGD